jgi:tetratricopeptide (TPR) repeat protein
MPSLKKESYPPHLLAQRQNNRGVAMLVAGRYDEAITTLVKALKLSEANAKWEPCNCKLCSLDACLSMSQTGPPLVQSKDSPSLINKTNSAIQCAECSADDEATSSDYDEAAGFVYRRPIRVHANSIKEGHNMGVVLSLIIIFNLALAHQLSAIAHHRSSSSSSSSSPDKRRLLQKAVQLYELAYQLHLDEHQECDDFERVESLRFTMIISNNLGEIHRIVGSKRKHEMCLRHLLQLMMYVVDSQIGSVDSIELDGFFRNTSQIMLGNNCARAA